MSAGGLSENRAQRCSDQPQSHRCSAERLHTPTPTITLTHAHEHLHCRQQLHLRKPGATRVNAIGGQLAIQDAVYG